MTGWIYGVRPRIDRDENLDLLILLAVMKALLDDVEVLDHLVLAGPDLAGLVGWFSERTGVAPVTGGSHVGLGTANKLVHLGGGSYLEIIGPDPEQPTPSQPRPFGIDTLTAPRLVTWAVRVSDLDQRVAESRRAGYDPGEPSLMSRRLPEGTALEWRLTPPRLDVGDGLIPFLIDWRRSPHPTSRKLPAAPLLSMRAGHPDPASLRFPLAALQTELTVDHSDIAALHVVVEGLHGR